MRDIFAVIILSFIIGNAVAVVWWLQFRFILWIIRAERAREVARALAAERATRCQCQLAEAERGVE